MELGTSGNPSLANSYSNFERAKSEADKIEEDISNHLDKYPPNARVVIFSLKFWADDEKAFPEEENGKVNMNGYPGKARMPNPEDPNAPIGYMNFDYGLYNKATNTWFSANHRQPGMRIYEKTLEQFSEKKEFANRQVFSFAISTVSVK